MTGFSCMKKIDCENKKGNVLVIVRWRLGGAGCRDAVLRGVRRVGGVQALCILVLGGASHRGPLCGAMQCNGRCSQHA